MRSFLSFLGAGAALSWALFASGCGDDSSGSGGGTGGETSGGGGSGGGALTGEPVKILNWNVKNFFDKIDSDTIKADDAMSAGEFDDKVDAVAAVLGEADADIVVFAEVENDYVLDAINDALGDRYPVREASTGRDPRGVNIAIMSKIDLTDIVSHYDDTFVVNGTQAPEYQFSRDLLEYHFTVGDQDVVLLGVHYKAKGTPQVPDNPDKRLAEAQRTRAVADTLTEENPDLAVIVLGDFNDLPDSPPLDAVVGRDPEYEDVAELTSEADRWTFDFEGTLELIDHQMANPKARSRVDPASVMIDHQETVSDATDHAPVMATYYFE